MMKLILGLTLGVVALAATPSLADDGCGGNGCNSARGKGVLANNAAAASQSPCGGNGCHSARGKGVLNKNVGRVGCGGNGCNAARGKGVLVDNVAR